MTRDLSDVTTGQHVRTKEYYINPDYDSRRIINDVALIKVTPPLVFDEHVRPACLGSLDTDPSKYTNCYATGWGGHINYNDNTGGKLMTEEITHSIWSLLAHLHEGELLSYHFVRRPSVRPSLRHSVTPSLR